MSKMSNMAMTIEELRSAAAAINEAASWLAEQFSGTADKAPAKEPAAKEEKKPECTSCLICFLFGPLAPLPAFRKTLRDLRG